MEMLNWAAADDLRAARLLSFQASRRLLSFSLLLLLGGCFLARLRTEGVAGERAVAAADLIPFFCQLPVLKILAFPFVCWHSLFISWLPWHYFVCNICSSLQPVERKGSSHYRQPEKKSVLPEEDSSLLNLDPLLQALIPLHEGNGYEPGKVLDLTCT